MDGAVVVEDGAVVVEAGVVVVLATVVEGAEVADELDDGARRVVGVAVTVLELDPRDTA